jgi:hypothetical protein
LKSQIISGSYKLIFNGQFNDQSKNKNEKNFSNLWATRPGMERGQPGQFPGSGMEWKDLTAGRQLLHKLHVAARNNSDFGLTLCALIRFESDIINNRSSQHTFQ